MKILACKSIRFGSGKTKEFAEREYNILSRLNHPNIVEYVGITWKRHKAKLYMEYCPGGSLWDLINERIKYLFIYYQH
jgi:serine/threonine protein kinase